MAPRILIKIDLGQRGVEKTDIAVSLDGELVQTCYDQAYSYLPELVQGLRTKYPDSDLEAWCQGQDCRGNTLQWQIEV